MEEKNMIKEFDQAYVKINKSNLQMAKIGGYVLLLVAAIGALMPIYDMMRDDAKYAYLLTFYFIIFELLGIIVIIKPYLVSPAEEGDVFIYDILRYTPCGRKVFVKSRINMIIKFCLPFSIIGIALKVVMLILTASPDPLPDICQVIAVYIAFPIIFALVYINALCRAKTKKK